jgi:hypothetical protein
MQDGSGNSFNCCQDCDQLHLARRIFMLSRIPWQTIKLAPSGGFGTKKIERTSIRRAVPSSVTDDVQFFYSLHYIGKKRFIGYRVGQVFYILWIDHNFSVYDHGS